MNTMPLTIKYRNFNGGAYHVWENYADELFLLCYSTMKNGFIFVPKSTIDAFIALEHDSKAIRFANPISHIDVLVFPSGLAREPLEPIDDGDGKEFYLIDVDTFSSEDKWPEFCGPVDD